MGNDPATPPTTTTPVEPGYTTTEFWATQVTSGLTIAFALASDFGLFSFSGQQRTDITLGAAFVVGVVQAAYALARGLRKQGQ